MRQLHALSYNKDIISNKRLVALIGVTFFAVATVLGSYVRIPVPGSPVPITLQTFFVLMSGAVLGRRLGAASQIAYIMLGSAGLGALGFAGIAGPTGGYIIGFVPAAFVVGYLTRSQDAGIARLAAAFTAGSLIVYAFGASWLARIYGIDLANAVSAGILPFIPGDIAKIALSALIYSRISARSKAIFSE